MKQRTRQGEGTVRPADLRVCGVGVVIEPGAVILHPENVSLGDHVYVGHYAVLNGYHAGELICGPGTWIGQHCLLHGAGGLVLGAEVGVGPGCRVLTSAHRDPGRDQPIMSGSLDLAPVRIGDGSALGCNAVVLGGVTIGRGVQVGAGAVVREDLADFSVAVGVPARVVRHRK
jgi:acetyltransferase-like isoleucine patch superfamily enzyme